MVQSSECLRVVSGGLSMGAREPKAASSSTRGSAWASSGPASPPESARRPEPPGAPLRRRRSRVREPCGHGATGARCHEGTLTMLALWLRASSPPGGGRPLAWTSSGAIPRSTTPLLRTGWHPATRGAGVALGLHSGVALGLQREAVRSQSALQPKQKGREVANVARAICAHRRLYTGT